MKALVFSDLHLSNFKSKYKIDLSGVSDLLIRQMKFADHILEEEFDIVLFLGDITDYEVLDPITLNYLSLLIDKFTKKTDFSIWLEGNHCIGDSSNHNTVLSAFQILKSKHHFLTSPSEIYYENICFHCFPYYGDFESIQKMIEERNCNLNSNVKNILLFHYPTRNALLDNNFPATKGLELTDEIIGNFDLVLGGDYHKHQKLNGATSAYYVGAPFMLAFNEDPMKGAMILDLDDLSFKMIDNPFDVKLFKCSYDEAKNYMSMYSSDRLFLKVENLSQDEFEELNEMRDKFYGLHLRRSRPKVNIQRKEFKRDTLDFDDYIKDFDITRQSSLKEIVSTMKREVLNER